MAKSKYHHYILVLTESGAKFVTKRLPDRCVEWKAEDAPLEFSAVWAEDITMGLNMNFFTAFHIKVPYEITHQPDNYANGHFVWIPNKNDN